MILTVLLSIISAVTTPPTISAQIRLTCGKQNSILFDKQELRLVKGRRTLGKIKFKLKNKKEIRCSYSQKDKLLIIDFKRVKRVFLLKNKSLILAGAVFNDDSLKEENVKKYDHIKKEFYRNINSITTCNDNQIRFFREKFVKNKGFVKIDGNSIKLPIKFKSLKAKPGPFPNHITKSVVPFKISSVSSWYLDEATGDFEPPSQKRLTDLNIETAWIGGSRSGKSSFFVFRRNYANYDVTGLRIFPGLYKNRSLLSFFRRIKSFYITDSKGTAYKITISGDPLKIRGGLKKPFIVHFPKPLRGKCITLIINKLFPLNKIPKSLSDKMPIKVRPPAISEITLFSSVDFEKHPLKVITKDFKNEKITRSDFISIVKNFSDTEIMAMLKKKSLNYDVKTALLISSVNRGDIFIPYFITVLPFAKGEFLKAVNKKLSNKSAAPFLEKIFNNIKNSFDFRKRALGLYLKSKPLSRVMMRILLRRKEIGKWAKLLMNKLPSSQRETVISNMCITKSKIIPSAVLWLGAKWTKKDKSLALKFGRCLEKGPGKGFNNRMRYLFAVEATGDEKYLDKIISIYKNDKRATVKARALKAASKLAGGKKLFNIAIKSHNPVIWLSIIGNYHFGQLPVQVVKKLDSIWPDVREAAFNRLAKRCDKRLIPFMKKFMFNSNSLKSKSLFIAGKCHFTTFSNDIVKHFENSSDIIEKAQYGMTLAMLKTKRIIPLLKKEILKNFALINEKSTMDKRVNALSIMVSTLDEYHMKSHDDFFVQLLKNPMPRLLYSRVISVLKTRCPKSLNNSYPLPKSKFKSRLIHSLKDLCKN